MMDEIAQSEISQSQSGPGLTVSVTEPSKHGDGMNAYITYKIHTSCRKEGYPNDVTVVRRFSDFTWLHTQLNANFAGVILPPLPDKALVGRFGAEFIESRRLALEDYLQRIAQHPMLWDSKHFHTFLQQPDELQHTPVKPQGPGSVAESPAQPKKGMFGLLRDFQVSTQISLTQSGWLKTDIPLPHDVQCAEMKAYLNALDAQLQSVQKFTQQMTVRHRDLASGLSEFGLAVTLLGNCETDTQYLANGLSQLGNSADRLSIIHHEHADQEIEKFENRIKDYIRTVACAKEAMKGREKALMNYHQALVNLDAKKQKLGKAEALQPPNPTKVADAQRDIHQGEEEVQAAQEEHERVSAVTRSEMQRFQREKVAYFKSMVVEYVKLQVECSKKVQGVWEGLLPEVEAVADQAARS